MTQAVERPERTPLAALAAATVLSEAAHQGGAPSNIAEAPHEARPEWWAHKKRKRSVACGRCTACCRDDCGACLNCLDKPKFGGQGAPRLRQRARTRRAPRLHPLSVSGRCAGIRKQSCLARKCQQPTAAMIPTAPFSAAAAPTFARAVTAKAWQAVSGTMPAHELDDFWCAVECCMRLQDAAARAGRHPDERLGPMGASKRARLAHTSISLSIYTLSTHHSSLSCLCAGLSMTSKKSPCVVSS